MRNWLRGCWLRRLCGALQRRLLAELHRLLGCMLARYQQAGGAIGRMTRRLQGTPTDSIVGG